MEKLFINLLETIVFDFILIILFYYLNKFVLKINQKKFLIGYYIFIIIIIFLTSIRLNVGSDFQNYVNISNFVRSYFNDNKEIILYYNIQFGFPILSKFMFFISENMYSFLWIVSIIIYCFEFKYIQKHFKSSNERFIAYISFVVFGFFSISLNILKQAMAMSIFVFAYVH